MIQFVRHWGPRVLSIGWLCLVTCLPAWGQRWWIDSEQYADLHIVLSERATLVERSAAAEFQQYWERCTGFRPEIGAEPTLGAINVWLGHTDNPFLDAKEIDALGDDGVLIRTDIDRYRPSVQGLHGRPVERNLPIEKQWLILAGGRTRGTLYAVYEFFERAMGVRWLTPDVTHIPPAPDFIPEIDYTFVPPIPYRDISYRAFVHDASFAAIHRLNGFWSKVAPELGGHTSYVRGWPGYGHTMFYFVSPDEYFAAHPDYFAEISGQRRPDAQLCLTNDDVFQIILRKVRELLAQRLPHERILSISQMDQALWCQCEACEVINQREGSPSGAIIQFVNRIADAISADYPDVLIDTFAYQYSRKPPKHVRPRDNVAVRLCSFECDFGRPLDSRDRNRNPFILRQAQDERISIPVPLPSRLNRPFAEDLRGWNRITKNLYVWDYTQNYYCYQGPHPNFHVFQPNSDFFARNGVAGLFEQASPDSPHSDFEYLKGYVLAKCLWDPQTDWRAHFNEFIDLYYREAAPFIGEYISLITNKVADDDVELTFLNHMEWMDADTVNRAREIFDRAFAATSDPSVRERLNYAYIPVQYAALVCPPDVSVDRDHLVLTRPPSQTFDEYWAMITRYGVTHLNDWPISRFRDRLNSQTPPRLRDISFTALENERYLVWVAPELGGSIIRLLDKRTGLDALDGFRAPHKPEGRIGAWTYDPQAPAGEHAIARAYDIVERSAESVVLRADLESGVRITRTVTLGPADTTLQLYEETANTGGRTSTSGVKLTAQFATAGDPRLRIKRDGDWQRVPLAFDYSGLFAADALDPTNLTAAAISSSTPKRGATGGLVAAFPATALESFDYVYDPGARSFALEWVPSQSPLSPGETRVIEIEIGSRGSKGRD